MLILDAATLLTSQINPNRLVLDYFEFSVYTILSTRMFWFSFSNHYAFFSFSCLTESSSSFSTMLRSGENICLLFLDLREKVFNISLFSITGSPSYTSTVNIEPLAPPLPSSSQWFLFPVTLPSTSPLHPVTWTSICTMSRLKAFTRCSLNSPVFCDLPTGWF